MAILYNKSDFQPIFFGKSTKVQTSRWRSKIQNDGEPKMDMVSFDTIALIEEQQNG